MYSVAVNNHKVIVGCSLWADTGNSWSMAELNSQAQGLQGNALKEDLVPMLKYQRVSILGCK
jgi:hypothetical protein